MTITKIERVIIDPETNDLDAALDKARGVHAGLVAKRDAARGHIGEIESKRRVLAFDAQTGDGKARKAADDLRRDAAALSLEIQDIDFAIIEAARRVKVAEAAIAAEAERVKARQVQEIATAAATRGPKIGEAARALRDEIRGLTDDLERMGRLGAPAANVRLVQLAMTRAIFPLLREAGLDIDTIPPGLRHDPAVLASNYVLGPATWADKLLAEVA